MIAFISFHGKTPGQHVFSEVMNEPDDDTFLLLLIAET